jgi:hypothetical protein
MYDLISDDLISDGRCGPASTRPNTPVAVVITGVIVDDGDNNIAA